MTEGIECDAVANFEAVDSDAKFDDLAGGLVAEDERDARDHPVGTEFPIDDVQIGTAHAAGADADEQFAFADFGDWSFDDFDAGSGTGFGDCFHWFDLWMFNTTWQCSASTQEPAS